MSDNNMADAILIKDEDSDCEIVGATPGLVDVPDYIDPKSLSDLMNEPKESLPPIVEKIVNKLTNDEEFDRECDKFYKANLDMDVEIVQVDVAKVLAEPALPLPPAKKINLSAEVDDIRTMKDLPDICAQCEQSDDHVELLLTHFKQNHHLKQGLYVCPFCDYTSSKYEVVMKHTTKVHKLVSEQHSCDSCNFYTFRGDLYNRHLNQHLKEKIYSCENCSYKTINLENFKKHLTTKHVNRTEFKCRSCDYTSNSQTVIKKHETNKHTKKMLFACDKCSFKTTRAHVLTRHNKCYCPNRDKKDVFTYVCVHCPFKTGKLSSLDEHTLLNHPKKEILFCNICDFSTTESSELTDHAQTHLKSEPSDS